MPGGTRPGILPGPLGKARQSRMVVLPQGGQVPPILASLRSSAPRRVKLLCTAELAPPSRNRLSGRERALNRERGPSQRASRPIRARFKARCIGATGHCARWRSPECAVDCRCARHTLHPYSANGALHDSRSLAVGVRVRQETGRCFAPRPTQGCLVTSATRSSQSPCCWRSCLRWRGRGWPGQCR